MQLILLKWYHITLIITFSLTNSEHVGGKCVYGYNVCARCPILNHQRDWRAKACTFVYAYWNTFQQMPHWQQLWGSCVRRIVVSDEELRQHYHKIHGLTRTFQNCRHPVHQDTFRIETHFIHLVHIHLSWTDPVSQCRSTTLFGGFNQVPLRNLYH